MLIRKCRGCIRLKSKVQAAGWKAKSANGCVSVAPLGAESSSERTQIPAKRKHIVNQELRSNREYCAEVGSWEAESGGRDPIMPRSETMEIIQSLVRWPPFAQREQWAHLPCSGQEALARHRPDGTITRRRLSDPRQLSGHPVAAHLGLNQKLASWRAGTTVGIPVHSTACPANFERRRGVPSTS